MALFTQKALRGDSTSQQFLRWISWPNTKILAFSSEEKKKTKTETVIQKTEVVARQCQFGQSSQLNQVRGGLYYSPRPSCFVARGTVAET